MSSAAGSRLYRGIAFLESLPRWEKGFFTPVSDLERLFHELGDPQEQVPAIHVAGTNGKGSVCTFISAILLAKGASAGQFASPHLSHVTQRCIVNGAPADIAAFDAALLDVADALRRLNIQCSFFAAGAAASFLVFSRAALDWAVVEVGLGGLYDATNLIRRPRASVITGIGFDHTHVLGSTLEEIARNKAGIIKNDVPVFVGRVGESEKKVIKEAAQTHLSPAFFHGEEYQLNERLLSCAEGSLLLEGNSPLFKAPYQWENAALAARVAMFLGIDAAAINQGLNRARWPGRAEELRVERRRLTGDQTISGAVSVLLDAAHNPQGMQCLLAHLRRRQQDKPADQIFFVLSILATKDWTAMIADLKKFGGELEAGTHAAPCSVRWIFTKSSHSGAVEPQVLCQALGAGESFDDAQQALQRASSSASANSLIVVTGSIYLLGLVRPMMTAEPFCTYVSEER